MNRLAPELVALLALIDGTAGFGRDLRTFPQSPVEELREIHRDCLELQRRGLVRLRRKWVWTSTEVDE